MQKIMVRSLLRIAIEILFPPICVACNAYIQSASAPICDACRQSIARNSALRCPICSIRLADNKRICNHRKQDMQRFPYTLGAATYYADPVARACIHAYKYQGVHALTSPLSDILVAYAQQLQPRPHIFNNNPLVIPIPLHAAKERKRGFNQSALIARSFADVMRFAYAEPLIKIVDNSAQAKEKTHADRFQHMRHAFAIPRPEQVRNKNIILIDDVSTSGATLAEAAQTLRTAGAKQILAFVIAKA